MQINLLMIQCVLVTYLIMSRLIAKVNANFDLPYTAVLSLTEEFTLDIFDAVVPALPNERYIVGNNSYDLLSIGKFEKISAPSSTKECILKEFNSNLAPEDNSILNLETPYQILQQRGKLNIVYWDEKKPKLRMYTKITPLIKFSSELRLAISKDLFPTYDDCSNLIYFVEIDSFYTICSKGFEGRMNLFLIRLSADGTGYHDLLIGSLTEIERMENVKLIKLTTSTPATIKILFYKNGSSIFKIVELEVNSRPISIQEYNLLRTITMVNYYANSLLVFYSKPSNNESGISYYLKLLPGDKIKDLELKILGLGMIARVDVETDTNLLKLFSFVIPVIQKDFGTTTDHLIMMIYSYDEAKDIVDTEYTYTFESFGVLSGIHKSFYPIIQSYEMDESSIKVIRLQQNLRLIRFDFTLKIIRNGISKYTYTQGISFKSKVLYNFHLKMQNTWDRVFEDYTGRGIWVYSSSPIELKAFKSTVLCRLFWFETENPVVKKIVGAPGSLSQYGGETTIDFTVQKLENKEVTGVFPLKIIDKQIYDLRINWLYKKANGKLDQSIQFVKEGYKVSIRELIGGGFIREVPIVKNKGEIAPGYSAELLYTKYIANNSQKLYDICVSEMTSAIKLFNTNPNMYHAVKLFSLVEYSSYPSNLLKEHAKSIPESGFCLRNKDNERVNSHCIIQIKGSEDHIVIAKNRKSFAFNPMKSIRLGNVVQVISFSIGKVITLSDKGEINLLEAHENLKVTSISYPGTACLNMEITYTSNSKALLACLSEGLFFTVFRLNELIKGLNTESVMYRDYESLFGELYNPKDMVIINPKLGGFKDLIFVFVKNSPINKINAFVFKLEVDSYFSLKLVMKMNIRPRPEESAAAYGMISDFLFFNEYLVCTVKGIKHVDYICVYNIGTDSYFGLGIILSSCYDIPSGYYIIEKSRIGLYRDYGAVDDAYPGYVTVQLEKSFRRAKNIYLIDPAGSNINRIKTSLLPFSLSDQMIVLDIYGENRKTVSESIGLMAYKEDNLDQSMLILSDFNTVGVKLAKFKAKAPNHLMLRLPEYLSKDRIHLKVPIKTVMVNEIELIDNKSPIEKIYLPVSFSLQIKSQEALSYVRKSLNELTLDIGGKFNSMHTDSNSSIIKIGVDPAIIGNVFETQIRTNTILQDSFYLKNYWTTEKLVAKLAGDGEIRIMESCSKMVIDNETPRCDHPITWIEDNTIIRELEGFRTNSSESLIYNHTTGCSKRTVIFNYFLTICSYEGNNYLEIVGVDSIKYSSIILNEIRDGEPINFNLYLTLTGPINILSIRNVVRGSTSTISFYKIDNIDSGNPEDLSFEFISKESFGISSIFWRTEKTLYKDSRLIKFYSLNMGLSGAQITNIINCKLLYSKNKNKWISLIAKVNTVVYSAEYNRDVSGKSFYNDEAMVIHFDNKFLYNESTNTFPLLFYYPRGHSFLVFCSNEKFQNMRKIRLKNPFAELGQKIVKEPICKDWLCVFPAIFVGNSYLSMYHVDQDWVEGLDLEFPYFGTMNNDKPSKHFTSDTVNGGPEIMENLLQNYTIYTFSVAYLPRVEISKIFWDPVQNKTGELSFFVITYDGDVLRYSVSRTLDVYLLNGQFENESVFNITYYGMANSTISKQVRLIGLKNQNILIDVSWLCFVVLLSATIIWMISSMILASNNSNSEFGN